jgi:hypothetical protein
MAKELKSNNTPSNDEIDLGQLFQMIGNGFKSLFNFFGNILKGIFHLIIQFLLFIRKHFVKFLLAGILGLALGLYLDFIIGPNYTSSMVVEPNFNSAQQLYNNISFYNELAEAKDSIALAEALDISISEAAAIKKLTVESYADENQKVQLFDRFVRSLDTTTQKTIDMGDYLKNFNSIDARFHTITMIASDKFIAKKVQPTIINSISRNAYFQLQQKINDTNLDLQDSIYKKQLVEIDSLQGLYKRVMEKEAENPLLGTSINLADNGINENKELALINKVDEVKQGLVVINQERANKSSILNVISAFPRSGVEAKGVWLNYKYLIPITFIIIVFIVLISISLNSYLKGYRNKEKL